MLKHAYRLEFHDPEWKYVLCVVDTHTNKKRKSKTCEQGVLQNMTIILKSQFNHGIRDSQIVSHF